MKLPLASVSISQLVVGEVPTIPSATIVEASVMVELSDCQMLPAESVGEPAEFPVTVSKRNASVSESVIRGVSVA